MPKNETINVSGVEVRVTKFNNDDYISLTDMLKAKDGDFFITDWLRNRNTFEYIGIWEKVYNPDFNYGEFATIRNQAGLHSFKIGVQEFTQRTNAISIMAKAGRYGGTYAHKDIYSSTSRRRPENSTGITPWSRWRGTERFSRYRSNRYLPTRI